MRIVELIIDESEKLAGVEAISLVEFPAIESNFVALQEQMILLKVDEEKNILIGPALIPNKNIYRRNKEEEYYIFFSDATVKQASELFLMNSNQNNTTLEHEKTLKDLTVVESWIVEDLEMDKSKLYGLSVPVGTWMVSIKVNNDEVWNSYVKSGKVKGYSIEGYFADKLEMSLQESKDLELIKKLKELILKSELKEGVDHYTIDGKLYTGLTHKQGDRLMTGAVHTTESEFLYHKDEIELIKKLKRRINMGNKTSSPKGGKRGCLCKNNTYSVKCCEGELLNQGVGSTLGQGESVVIVEGNTTTLIRSNG